METVFIINPKSGSKKDINKLKNEIEAVAREEKRPVKIYVTKGIGDATDFVRDYCDKNGAARFIACGGDGTLNEVLNGAVKTASAEVGVMPLGTGNDFTRNFENRENFYNVKKLLNGRMKKCDAVFYTSECDGKTFSGYAVNMFNIGFDCNVVDMTDKMKKKPFVSGSFAYFLSIFAVLIKKKGANLRIELDGKQMHNGKLLLTSIANGSFCGGGVRSNPEAEVSDGFMDINIIKNISRLNFLTKLPFYMKGTHTKLKNIEKVIFSAKCKKCIITPVDEKMRLCVDGEIMDAERTEFELIHNAFNFIVP